MSDAVTLGDRVLEIIARRRAEREQPLTLDALFSRPPGYQREPLERGMVSEETSERVAKPHETPCSIPVLSVAEFYKAHQVNGRAVLSYTNYRDSQDVGSWIVCIKNKFRMASYWLCHHERPEIKQVSPEAEIGRLGVAVTVFRRAD